MTTMSAMTDTRIQPFSVNIPEDALAVMQRMTPAAAQFPIEGNLPSLDGATEWLNSPPLTGAGLRGHEPGSLEPAFYMRNRFIARAREKLDPAHLRR